MITEIIIKAYVHIDECVMQRSAAQDVLSINIGTSVKQSLFHIEGSIDGSARNGHGKVQCSALVLIAGVRIGSLREQQLDHFEILASGGNVQRGKAECLVSNVDLGLVIDQVLDDCCAALLDSNSQSGIAVQ